MLEAFSEGGGTVADWLDDDPKPRQPARPKRPTGKARVPSPGDRGAPNGGPAPDPETAALMRRIAPSGGGAAMGEDPAPKGSSSGKVAPSKAPRLPGAPTPEERADLVVMNLENFIRDHRTRSLSGMKVSDWKSQARKAVLESLIEAEETQAGHLIHTNRWILVGCATVVSVGFWAAVYLVDKDYGTVAALLLGLFAFILIIVAMEGFLRRAVISHRGTVRARRWLDIRSFDDKVKRLRRSLEDTLKELEETTEDAKKLREKLGGGRKGR
jgi:hypothetical protein